MLTKFFLQSFSCLNSSSIIYKNDAKYQFRNQIDFNFQKQKTIDRISLYPQKFSRVLFSAANGRFRE